MVAGSNRAEAVVGDRAKIGGWVDYRPSKPRGRIISSDANFVLRADEDGVGFVQCDDGVLVVPLDDDGNVLLAVERSAALNREALGLAGGWSSRTSRWS